MPHTSEPNGAGHGAYGDGPEGTTPPADCLGSGDGVGCLDGPHLPPPGKVTSWSSSLRFLLLNGHAHVFRGTARGHFYFAKCNLLSKIFHELTQLVVSKVSKFHLKTTWHSPALGSLLRRCMWLSLPIWVADFLCHRLTTPFIGVACALGLQWWTENETL